MTQLFGIDAAEVRALAGAVSDDDAADVFARAAWTCIAEPGDRVAGALVAALGAADALTALVNRDSAASLAPRVDVEERMVADLTQAMERWMPRLLLPDVRRALTQAARFRVRLITPASEHWPVGVNDLGAHTPLALWVRGQLPALAHLDRSIALVGARAATGYGEYVAMEASAGLVDRGYAIVSGAAYGIDGMAHRAALASKGMTVAVLAGGVDRFYPSGHDALLTRIVESGAVVSEVPCGVPPTKWRFLQRNRLIAAMSQATVVLEAGWRSGSLNTAGHAVSLGRPLGAVPGPVTSAASAGCHRLIRSYGAACVTNADEMAELAPTDVPMFRDEVPSPHHSEQSRLLDTISDRAPRAAADLAKRSGLSLAGVQALLGRLELEGAVVERDRGWMLAPPPKKEKPLA
jgi:DNA processing protein